MSPYGKVLPVRGFSYMYNLNLKNQKDHGNEKTVL